MAFTQKIIHAIQVHEPGGTVNAFNWTESNTTTQENNVSESIPDSSTDLEVAWSADVTAMKSFAMWADGDLLVETNSGSTPTDSFSLVANEVVTWTTSSTGIANPITGDVTTNIFCTNASGAAVQLEIRMIQDATP